MTSVTAIMMVGKKEEPFLEACLACLHGCVDYVILNDNSGEVRHRNRDIIEASKLFGESKIEIISSPFLGFGACRNLCIERMKELERQHQWAMIVDSDEIHPQPELAIITRKILPHLPSSVGIVDGYYYDFFQSPRYFHLFGHRHNLFFRLFAETSWKQEVDVHEQLCGLQGERYLLPHFSFHYGYLKDNEAIRSKWTFYGSLGDAVSGEQANRVDSIVHSMPERCWLYLGRHPRAAEANLAQYEYNHCKMIKAFEKQADQVPLSGVRARLKKAHIRIKMRWIKWTALLRHWRSRAIREAIEELHP